MNSGRWRGFLEHWSPTVFVILIFAALSFQQADKYTLGLDAYRSLANAGWLDSVAYSPADVLNAVYSRSPNQGPVYFLLLNAWGLLARDEIALARLLTIYFALLALAMIYRLAHDAISPIAGIFAVIILASNAFFSFYVVHARYYPLLVLLATLVLWLYWRIVILRGPRDRRDYVGLIFACSTLVSLHAYGLLLYVVLALFHLFFVPKNGRWLSVVVAAAAGLALAAPLIYVMFTAGVDRSVADHGSNAGSLGEILTAWFSLTANGSPVLILFSLTGAAIGWRRKSVVVQQSTRLMFLLLVAVVAVTIVTGIVSIGTMRHLLPGMPIAVLFQAAALYALCRERKLFAMLLCLWPIAGIASVVYTDWPLYIQGRNASFELPPWHQVSREALRSGDPAHIVAYRLPDKMMYAGHYGPASLREYFFDHRNVEFRMVGATKWLAEYLRHYEGSRLSPWLVYQRSRMDDAHLKELESTMNTLGYRPCERVSLPVKTEMVKYSWIALDCQPARLQVSNLIEPLQYGLYGVETSTDGSTLYFAYKWSPRSQDALDRLNISHQLISEDWENVGQLDRPLASADKLRQFAIDVSDVPPGRYRLMAIVYDPITGKTLDWQGAAGNPPSMLFLREVEIR